MVHKRKFACYIDLRKAFDTVNREALFNLLPHYGFCHTAMTMIRNLYDNDDAIFKVDRKCTGHVKASVGVKQGSILSPLLFTIFMDHVFKNLNFGNDENITILAYADDIVIFADSENEMKNRIAEFNEVVNRLGMKVNPTKTKVMDAETPRTWSLQGQVKTYIRPNIGLRNGKDTRLTAMDTKIVVPAKRVNMQGKVVRTALNCPFADCPYTAGTRRVGTPHALLKKHMKKMHNITIEKFVHHMFVNADVRICNRPVTPGKNNGTEDMDTGRFHIGTEALMEVHTFKYLGSLVSNTDSVMLDLKRRRALTLGALRNLHKVLKRFSRAESVRTVETFVMPILLFGSETYPSMTQREMEYMTASYMLVLRRATRMMVKTLPDGSVRNHPNEQVMKAAKRKPLVEVLKTRRDTFLRSMVLDPLVQRLPAPNW